MFTVYTQINGIAMLFSIFGLVFHVNYTCCCSILPMEALLLVYRFLGVDCAMDGFYGNKKKPVSDKND